MERQAMLERLQDTKKQHNFKDFLLDIVSRYPLVLYRQHTLISLYPDTERSCQVIPHEAFVASIDGLTKRGLNYDHKKSFFENFSDLYYKVPFSALYNYSGAENSEYAFSVLNAKNCYLSFTVISDCEDIFYSFAVKEGCRSIFNSIQVSDHSEDVYQSTCVVQASRIFYSKFIENSSNIWFSTNMIGCYECLFCDALENQSYCIGNEQYTKQDYKAKKAQILTKKEKFHERYLTQVTTPGANHGSTSTKACEFVTNSVDVTNGKYCQYLHQAKNVMVVGSPKENEYMYDAFEAGAHGNKHFYGALNAGVNSEHIYNCEGIVTCMYVFYSRFLENCSYCFGCIGLKNKQYCILNKQYTKEAWHEEVHIISQKMKEQEILGSYFPATANPFYFNDTIAHMVGNFTKEEVVEKGFLRRDKDIQVDILVGAEVVKTSELEKYEGGKFGRTDPEIRKKVIQDETGNVYRIMEAEQAFLDQYDLPLPRTHWLERMRCNFS